MSIVYRPKVHDCLPPAEIGRYPNGTIFRCDECGSHLVLRDRRWVSPLPFSLTAWRIKRLGGE